MGVPIQAVKKRGFLRQIREAAKKASPVLSMGEALLAAQSGAFSNTFARGRLVVSQSGAGQSGSFEIGVQGKEWTQDNIFGLIEELLELSEDLVANGSTDSPDASALDAFFALMIEDPSLQTVRSYMGDYTGLNYPTFGGATA